MNFLCFFVLDEIIMLYLYICIFDLCYLNKSGYVSVKFF